MADAEPPPAAASPAAATPERRVAASAPVAASPASTRGEVYEDAPSQLQQPSFSTEAADSPALQRFSWRPSASQRYSPPPQQPPQPEVESSPGVGWSNGSMARFLARLAVADEAAPAAAHDEILPLQPPPHPPQPPASTAAVADALEQYITRLDRELRQRLGNELVRGSAAAASGRGGAFGAQARLSAEDSELQNVSEFLPATPAALGLRRLGSYDFDKAADNPVFAFEPAPPPPQPRLSAPRLTRSAASEAAHEPLHAGTAAARDAAADWRAEAGAQRWGAQPRAVLPLSDDDALSPITSPRLQAGRESLPAALCAAVDADDAAAAASSRAVDMLTAALRETEAKLAARERELALAQRSAAAAREAAAQTAEAAAAEHARADSLEARIGEVMAAAAAERRRNEAAEVARQQLSAAAEAVKRQFLNAAAAAAASEAEAALLRQRLEDAAEDREASARSLQRAAADADAARREAAAERGRAAASAAEVDAVRVALHTLQDQYHELRRAMQQAQARPPPPPQQQPAAPRWPEAYHEAPQQQQQQQQQPPPQYSQPQYYAPAPVARAQSPARAERGAAAPPPLVVPPEAAHRAHPSNARGQEISFDLFTGAPLPPRGAPLQPAEVPVSRRRSFGKADGHALASHLQWEQGGGAASASASRDWAAGGAYGEAGALAALDAANARMRQAEGSSSSGAPEAGSRRHDADGAAYGDAAVPRQRRAPASQSFGSEAEVQRGGVDPRPFATALSTAAAAAREGALDATLLALCQERDSLNLELQRIGPGAGRTLADRARKAAAEARIEAVTRELAATRAQARALGRV